MKKYIPVLLFLPLLYGLIFLYLSRSHYRHAELGIKNGIYEPISHHLEKALALLPQKSMPFLCMADLQRIHTAMGKVWYEKGNHPKINVVEKQKMFEKSLKNYQKAFHFGTKDLTAVKGIAETTAGLEFLTSGSFPARKNTYNALPLFSALQKKHPANLNTQLTVAEYFYKKGLNKRFSDQITHMVETIPKSFFSIKKEAFYSAALIPDIKRGLKNAENTKKALPYTYMSLSLLNEEEKNFSLAAVYLSKAMAYKKIGKNKENYFKLAFLYSEGKEPEQANFSFLQGLQKSQFPHKDIDRIYNFFKRKNDYAGYIAFADFARKNGYKSIHLHRKTAAAQIRTGQLDKAAGTLNRIISSHPDPESYYLLAKLAEIQKDWDQMELAGQKATVLAPANAKYIEVFADALIYQKKYKAAANQIIKAIQILPEKKRYQKKLEHIKAQIN